MNIETGELRRSLPKEAEGELEKWKEVPDELQEEAEKELNRKEKTMVDLDKDTPLTKWVRGEKQGRNNKCACGSGKKYKKCCGRKEG